MQVFMALWIGFGLVYKHDLSSYWTTDAVTSTPFFSMQMSRNRFEQILSMLHLNDNANHVARGDPGHDPLFKVRPIYDMLRNKFRDIYVPDRDVSLDEGMCPWKGRVSFKVYNPMKPDRFGMKLHQICESRSSYCVGFDVYTGSGYDPNPDAADGEVDQGQSHQVVMGLLRHCRLLGKGYRVYMDNYYSSPTLFDTLRNNDTMPCGTVRLNRKEMPAALKKKLNTGS